MNMFERYLVELLQGHITYNGSVVEVRKQFSNDPSLPVITLDVSRGVNTEYTYRVLEEQDNLCFYRSTTININLWCNTEEERENINNQILECWYDEKNNHYKYCTKYSEGNCTTLDTACPAITDTDYRGVKQKCPLPDEYEYESLAHKYGLVNGTIVIEPPFDLDEVDKHPPLLRSVLVARAEYTETVSSKGNTGLDHSYGVEII